MGCSLSVDGERLRVGVVDCVALLVVAGILLNAGTRVQTSYRLSNVHERLVITAAGEASCGDIDTLLGHILDKKLLDHVRARSAGEVVGAAISIENTEVTTTNHVEVQVGEDVVRLGGVEILSVVFRP